MAESRNDVVDTAELPHVDQTALVYQVRAGIARTGQLFLLQAAACGRDGASLLKLKANPAVAALRGAVATVTSAAEQAAAALTLSRVRGAAGRALATPPVDWVALSQAVEVATRQAWLGWVGSGRGTLPSLVREQSSRLLVKVHCIAVAWARSRTGRTTSRRASLGAADGGSYADEDTAGDVARIACALSAAASQAFLLV